VLDPIRSTEVTVRVLIASFVLALAACGQTNAPASQAPAPETAPAAAVQGEPMATGLMGGMSDTIPDAAAGLMINRDSLAFSTPDGEEAIAATDFLGVVAPSTLVAEGGQSFAALASSENATRVELRGFTSPAPSTLCPEHVATYVALVHGEPLTALRLVVFTGPDAPGPNARDSAVCATYSYAVD
jgi:hypothetical protein